MSSRHTCNTHVNSQILSSMHSAYAGSNQMEYHHWDGGQMQALIPNPEAIYSSQLLKKKKINFFQAISPRTQNILKGPIPSSK